MASQIHLRLYEELNDFLPPRREKRRFAVEVNERATVGELLASLGVRNDQVELVLVNGESVDFPYRLKDGDFVSVYPVFESFDVKPLVRVRAGTLRRIRFLVGPDLIRLARYLRILGYDAFVAGRWPLEKTIRVAEEERRVLLTRNPSLAQSPDLSRVYRVRKSKPAAQLAEVLRRLDLADSAQLSRLKSFPGRKTK
jgi:sulfur carrier protein ThiS